MEERHTHLRAFLASCAIANPLLYGVARHSFADDYDPLGPRLVLAAICGAGLAAGRARPSWLSPATAVAIASMLLWFLHLAHVNGTTFVRVLVVASLLIASVLLERPRDALLLTAVALAGAVWAYTGTTAPEIPLGMACGVLVAAGGGSAIVVHFRNRLTLEIAHQRQQAAALTAEVERRRAAEEAALQASRSKSTFLANMSHELRTPLNAIIGYTELVSETADPELVADLDRVLVSARHLLQLIDEVLDLARIEAGRFELSVERVELPPLIAECLGVVQPAADAKGLTVRAEAAGGVARADRVRTKQILINLLSNAVKFTPSGTVTVSVHPDGERVRVRVVDTGIGVDPSHLPRLFEAFEQVRGVHNPTGTGLGLTIGRELAERMGGTLTATSTPGVGSTFELALPSETASAA